MSWRRSTRQNEFFRAGSPSPMHSPKVIIGLSKINFSNYVRGKYHPPTLRFEQAGQPPYLNAGADLLFQGRSPSTISAKMLNFCVRDGNRCSHFAKGTSIQTTKNVPIRP